MKLVVFDCDGTLVDSQANIIRAAQESFTDAGLAAPEPHAIRRIVGLSLVEAMQALLPEADAGLHHQLAESYKQTFRRLRADARLDPEPLFDGIEALLNELSDQGHLLAVATGKSDRGLKYCLEHHNIAHYFISLQTADRHPSKPHPAMLHAAMTDAGAEAQNTMIIGDTVFDMEMGQAANVRAIGVSWGYHERADLISTGAIGVADDTTQLKELIHG